MKRAEMLAKETAEPPAKKSKKKKRKKKEREEVNKEKAEESEQKCKLKIFRIRVKNLKWTQKVYKEVNLNFYSELENSNRPILIP